MHKIFLAFLFLCVVKIADTQELPIYDVSKPYISFEDFTVNVFEDPSNKLEIDSISKLHQLFKPAQSRYTIKSIKQTYWFAFELSNSSSEKIEKIIGFDEVFLETVNIYYPSVSGWNTQKSGMSVPMDKKPLRNRCPLFLITLEPGETKTIYLEAYSAFALVTGITIDNTAEFVQKEQRKVMWYWGYLGAAIAILMYNLFLLAYIRERVYFYYVIYAICFVTFIFVYSGYLQYVTSNVKINYSLDVSIAIMGVFITLFTRELLQTKKTSLLIDKILLLIAGIYTVIAILIPIDIYFYQGLVSFGAPSMLFLLFTGIYSYIKKVKFSGFYILAMSSYLLGLTMIGAVNLGLIPYNILTRYGFMIGSLIELVLFSLALGYRIKHLQDEKDRFQQKLLISEKDQNKQLEKQVKTRTEELTIMNNKLQKLARFKEDMTGMIIHDLKNPLNAIMNTGKMNDEIVKSSIIEQSGHKMLNLLQNLLDVYKSENGEFELNKSTLILNNIISETLNEMHYMLQQKSIKVNLKTESDYSVIADENIIKRIIINILSNAIKASPNKGNIDIETSLSHDHAKICISNQGAGIPKSEQKLIFDKFKQLRNERNKNYSSGLGLAFCKMAIEAHQGKIGVISENSTGATFWISIPNAIRHERIGSRKLSMQQESLILSPEDKEYLLVFAKDLRKYKTFDVWEINRILDNIKHKNKNISKWLVQLDHAIYSGNNKSYEELLKLDSF